MKLLYTHENRLLVYNMLNIVQRADIDTLLKNEYASAAAGDLAPHETWLELWVKNTADYERALQLIKVPDPLPAAPWICSHCNESNDAHFELCWQCEHERPF